MERILRRIVSLGSEVDEDIRLVDIVAEVMLGVVQGNWRKGIENI